MARIAQEAEMTVYMAVEMDEYELPCAVADSCRELARLTGFTPKAIYNAVNKAEEGLRTRFVRVDIGEEEE